tara:strand:+ start:174 stop:326 length:153 start_codon:yes stop_codon:yes gene_type:complete
MLKKLLNTLSDLFTPKTRQQIEEEYLSQAIDRYDLEWRQRELLNKKGYWI